MPPKNQAFEKNKGDGGIILVQKPQTQREDNAEKSVDQIDRYYQKMYKKNSYKFLNDMYVPTQEAITTTKTLSFNEIIKSNGIT